MKQKVHFLKAAMLLLLIMVTAVTGVQAQEESMNETPLSFEAVENGTVITLTNNNSAVVKFALRTYVSPTEYTDDVWYTVQNTNTINLNAGDILVLRSTCQDMSSNFKIYASNDVYVYGNPLSLVSQADYKTMTDLTGCANGVLQELFRNGWDGNPHIKNHPTKDIVLPATTLSYGCYNGMFMGTGLTRTPQLPATTLADRCYNHMFSHCTALTETSELPATTLADECYHSMFEGCTALTDAPALPAMTLTYSCYDNMFRDCTNLINAPELLAPVLAQDSYYWMFYGCKNLTYVKCLATDISASGSTNNFLGNVSPTGTFVKADGMEDWTRDYYGIPEGWTIVDESETGIRSLFPTLSQGEEACYTLDGRKLAGQPTAKGLYIYKGKKVLNN